MESDAIRWISVAGEKNIATLNLAKGTAGRLLENMCKRIVQEAETLYTEIAADNTNLSRERPNLSATLAGELRCLRTIQYNIIREMALRIA